MLSFCALTLNAVIKNKTDKVFLFSCLESDLNLVSPIKNIPDILKKRSR